jgi:hypothetical protein
MMTTVSLLISPITWYFYLVLALLPLAYATAAVWRRTARPGEVAAAVGVFALLSVSQAALLTHGSAALLEPAFGLVLLGLLLVWLTRQERTPVIL